MRRVIRATATVAAVVLALVLVPASAQADDVVTVPASGSWAVEGRGWGHGIGMSQWGAQGAALKGLTAEQILDFYYPGTTRFDIGQDYPLKVRLSALAGASATMGPVPGGSLVVKDVASTKSAAVPAGARVLVKRTSAGFTTTVVQGATQTPLAIGGVTTVVGPVEVTGAGGTQVWAYRSTGTGVRYPGKLRASATSTTALEVINYVPMEQYLRGVVPRESPSSWAPAALQAQAVAARSYALSVRSTTGSADICDTTSCQVYGGAASSTAGGTVTELFASGTDAAIVATARIARYYGGGPAFTQFSSTNGGYSKAGSKPYLVAKADPYSGTAPGDTRTRWTSTLSVARVEASCPSGGKLQRMVLTRDGLGDLGGRIKSAKLECTTGTATVSTPAFGLLSSWWRPTSVGVPLGNLELVAGGSGTVRVKGWALDPDLTTAPVSVRVTYAGLVKDVVANLSRPDVGSAYPASGPLHGFDVSLPTPAGVRSVCVTVLNVGSGANLSLGCQTVTVTSGAPYGSIDAAVGTAATGAAVSKVTVTGWSVDPDALTTSLSMQVLVDGKVVKSGTANGSRPDVAAAVTGAGPDHGYRLSASASPGSHQVCARALDVPSGAATSLGCRTVKVPGAAPRGTSEVVAGRPGGVLVSGWALDPDTTAPTYVWLNVDGHGAPARADVSRSDVAAANPRLGPLHGYSTVVAAAPGTHTVCVTSINVGPAGPDTALGCRTTVVPGGSPFGNLEVVEGVSTGVHVKGWAIDPDTTASPYVWVAVDGKGQYLRASLSRADVGKAYPLYGSAFGFDGVVAAAAGSHRVCVTVANTGVGTNTAFACRTVTVPAH